MNFFQFLWSLILAAPFSALAAPCSLPQANYDVAFFGFNPEVKTLIGSPSSRTMASSDGKGCFRHHQVGSIYWSPETGPHFLRGVIRERWLSLGGGEGILGYPVTNEELTPEGIRFNRFQGGSIQVELNGNVVVHGG